ncbi:MAG: hypothetical protein HZY76_05250 [Anaerolineae bacterium]|nr:MAG: hypothetical protein HZY76_05250 [Anaerolineae bacterium]
MSNHPFLKFMAVLFKVIGIVLLVLGIVSALGFYTGSNNTFDIFGFRFTFPSAVRWGLALTPLVAGVLGFLWYYTLGSVISVLLETNRTSQATAKSIKDIELTWVTPRTSATPALTEATPVAPPAPTETVV